MKHFEDRELCQFRLGFENQLWCRGEDCKFRTCGSCQSCVCVNKLHDTTQWLEKAGGALKLKFLMGVLIRCKSVDILESTLKIIQVALGKDFTYARSRQKPKAPDDLTTWSHSGTIDRKWLGTTVLETWDWFSGSKYWVKANYIIGLLSLCETGLLQALSNLTRVLIEREKQASLLPDSVAGDHELDASSIPESRYSFCAEDRPELELLLRTRTASMVLDLPGDARDPHSPEIVPATPSNLVPGPGLPQDARYGRFQTPESGAEGTESSTGAGGPETPPPEDPALTVVPGTSRSLSGVRRHRDFIRGLPVHLAKRILGLLDRTALLSCHHVSQHWRFLTEEVQEEIETKRVVENQAMIMQGSSTAYTSSVFSRIREVLVPSAENQEEAIPEAGQVTYLTVKGFESAYSGCTTKTVEMEEKNMFCGAYNILVLSNREDWSRVVHYSGGQLVAVGSKDRLVRLLDVRAMRQRTLAMQGHAGSVRAVYLCEDRGLVISTGYDLTIRCWDLGTGACVMLFRGHFGTINCLDLHGNTLVSGAKDCRVKVWNLRTGRNIQRLRFRHDSPVQCVRVGRGLVLSSCDRGVLKLWDLDTGGLLKLIPSQQGSVKCLHLDQWHLLSGGADGFVSAWSTSREHSQSLMTYRHPREVLTLMFLFLRVITGCADGKIRVFDFLTGNCLRIFISNSQGSPVLSLHIHENNIVINTRASVLIFQFGEEGSELSESVEGESAEEEDSPRNHPRSPVPARSRERRGSSGAKQAEKDSLSHHAPGLSTPSMQREKSAQQRPLRPATDSVLQRHHPSLAYSGLHSDPNAKPPTALCPRTATGRASQRPKTTSCIPVRRPVVPVKWGWARNEEAKKQGPSNKHAPSEADVSQQPRRCGRSGCLVHPDVGACEAWGPPPSPLRTQPGAKASLPGATSPATPTAASPASRQIRPFTASPSLGRLHPHAGRAVGGSETGRPGGSSGSGSGKTVCKVGGYTTTAERDIDPDRCVLSSAPCGRAGGRRHVGFQATSDPAPAATFDPFRRRSPFRLLTAGQQEEREREAQREHEEACARERRREERQRRRAWRMMAKGRLPGALYRKEDQIYAPELGPGTYI
ncbi:F-box and WD repeat domain containing protein 10B [Conger conger]|uniref:F-box and WD repeat domain containing protein 10B n=1 Tax=Conger conger TaxID=82655 RepID=UPI002A5A9A07|nr:F-box and WD repeat domain containing protein 10B [Conger conger]